MISLASWYVPTGNVAGSMILLGLQHSAQHIWSLKLSELRTKWSYKQAYKIISHKLDPSALQLQPNKTISSQQRKTQAKLCESHHNAQSKRKQFLDDLLCVANAAKDKNQCYLILGLKNAEDNWCCFQLVQQQLNLSTPGGLTHLLVPDPKSLDKWTTICDTAAMEHHLLECSRTHFKQAHGTLFTTPPLSDLLGFDGLTPFGEQITKGNPILPDIALDPATELLLSYQKTLLPTTESTEHPLDFELLMKGFKNGLNTQQHLRPDGIWACTNPCSRTYLLATLPLITNPILMESTLCNISIAS